MPILDGDIKILKSEIMSDVPEGGGGVTGQAVVNGVSNNMFDDISTLDRVYGAVHIRKIFGAVQTDTVDHYYGAHAILAKLPGDQKIGVNLFATGDWFDRRPAAASRIESYRAQGPIYNGYLWGTQYQGSRALTIFQSTTASIPGVGDVLMLVTGANSQYVRIVDITDSIQDFTDATGTYKRRILELEISDVLSRDFVGAQMSRLDSLSPTAAVYKTVVANAARYYSARPLAIAADLNDLTVKVDSIYSQVVPSSQSEVALTDIDAASITAPVIDAAQANASFTTSVAFTAGSYLYLGSPCLPGSLSIPVSGSTLVDNAGNVKSGSTVIGSIDYAAGVINFASTSPTYSGSKTVTYRPAAAPELSADTAALRVTAGNRGYVWAITLTPPPKPGALRVSYRALDKWYELRDNSDGGLIADEPGIGTGSVNYTTGTVSVTTAALPDAETNIMFAWGQSADFINRSAISVGKVEIKHQLGHLAFDPDSLVITWNDGAARTANSDAAGIITGDATGSINLTTGIVSFSPTSLPLGGTLFNFAYNWGTPITKTLTAFSIVGNMVTLDVADTNLVAGSLSVAWDAPWIADPQYTAPIGSGVVKQEDSDNGAGALRGGRSSSINYTAGTLEFNHTTTATYKSANYGFSSGWSIAAAGEVSAHEAKITGYTNRNIATTAPAAFVVTYRKVSAATSANESLTFAQLDIDLTPGYAESIVPSSVLFTLGGRTYVDRSGLLYYGIDRATGAGTPAGTIDYSSGQCVLSAWASGQSSTPALLALATTMNYQPVEAVTFRTQSAPIKVGVFQVTATLAEGGGTITATADSLGMIATADMQGTIDYQTGVIAIRFGALVAAAGNESKPWYNAANVTGGQIWKPKLVRAESVVYTTVSYTYIPLSSAILGLDPVRLPADGRVPIYAPGDVVVVLNDQTTVGTFTSSSTTNLGRVRLAKASIRDLGGNALATSKYTINLDTGVITWGDLSGVSQPLTIVDRIEDMAMLSDVQITGELALSQPLTHNFPLLGTLVANAVIWGTLYARLSVPFSQQTWTGVWSDARIGSAIGAQYNNTVYPIAVDNRSAIQERWTVVFTSATAYNVTGEHVGQIISGNTSTNCAPINPNTGLPYFTITAAGWGGGWAAGNVLRFNTYAANAPVHVIQSIAQGEATDTDYTFCLEVRGDIDTP